MASAREMVDKLESALAENVGVVSVSVDGTSVRYDRAQAMEELKFWRRRLARESGRRPIVGQINLGGAW